MHIMYKINRRLHINDKRRLGAKYSEWTLEPINHTKVDFYTAVSDV